MKTKKNNDDYTFTFNWTELISVLDPHIDRESVEEIFNKRCAFPKNNNTYKHKHEHEYEITTVEDIRRAASELDVEICGAIIDNQFVFTSTGNNANGRGSCAPPPGTHFLQQWHTHAHVHRFYPSMEDIMKVAASDVNLSFIFTVHGVWVLRCDKRIDIRRYPHVQKHITHILHWFGSQQCRDNGRRPAPYADFGLFRKSVEMDVFKSKLSVDFKLEWHSYAE